jgi:hypothetical protein
MRYATTPVRDEQKIIGQELVPYRVKGLSRRMTEENDEEPDPGQGSEQSTNQTLIRMVNAEQIG